MNRHEMAYSLRQKGKTYREIGEIIGSEKDPSKPIHQTTAKMMVDKQERRMRSKPARCLEKDIQENVSIRVYNCLKGAGFKFDSRQEIIDGVESGKIAAGKIPNLGAKSVRQLREFLGMGVDISTKRKDLRVTLKPEDSAYFQAAKMKAEHQVGHTMRDGEFAARIIQQFVRVNQ